MHKYEGISISGGHVGPMGELIGVVGRWCAWVLVCSDVGYHSPITATTPTIALPPE